MNIGFILQTLSVISNAISLLLNKFILQNLSFMNTVLINMLFSVGISILNFKKIIAHTNIIYFRLYTLIAALNTLGIITLYYSMENLSPTIFGILNRFYIIFTLLISFILFKEKLSFLQFSLVILSIIGTVMFIFKDFRINFDYFSIITCILSSFFFASSYTIIKANNLAIRHETAFFYNNIIGLLSIALYFTFSDKKIIYPSFSESIFLFGASLFFFISNICFFNGLKYLSFIKSNLIRSFSPIFLTLISFPFFPEKLSLLNIIGGLVILISITLIGVVK